MKKILFSTIIIALCLSSNTYAEEDTIKYENLVKENKFLVIVRGNSEKSNQAKGILESLNKGTITLHK
ncbi:MAG: hypothetical protein P794_10045 [Epsilonproteobacteria bacterium (ex Lamellibrachia satsuma)]|nr:MAG: hypothetical protein P794_10045 [Epsilonproteobacteria bacterium (ex Lamellibrachia satsuma)]